MDTKEEGTEVVASGSTEASGSGAAGGKKRTRGETEKQPAEVIVLDLDSEDEASHLSVSVPVNVEDLSEFGIVDVEIEAPTKSHRPNLARMRHTRHGRPLGNLVSRCSF